MTSPDSSESHALRRALVHELHAEGHLRSPRIAAAIEAVPRELFVPGLDLAEVYRSSEAIVTKRVDGVGVSSASAPNVVALMLEQLDARPGHHVLEIGAGTGYNAALLAQLVGPTGSVTTLDIDEDLVLAARQHLRAAGCEQVEVLTVDGALGSPVDRTFDRIILTVASRDIAPAWREQLAQPDGRLVLPLQIRGPQRSIAFHPENGHLVSMSLQACQFISLRGVLAAQSVRMAPGPRGVLSVALADESAPVPGEAIGALLEGLPEVFSSGVYVTLEEVRDALHLWLVAHDPGVCTVFGEPSMRALPDLFGVADRFRGSLCVADANGVALLSWAEPRHRTGELSVVAPSGSRELAHHFVELLRQWSAAGRPGDAQLTIRAYPRGQAPERRADEVRIEERWTTFVLRWSGHSVTSEFI